MPLVAMGKPCFILLSVDYFPPGLEWEINGKTNRFGLERPASPVWQGWRELAFAIFSGDPERRDAVPVALREEPEGGLAWNKRARRLQGQLVSRRAGVYG